jgi:LmbE family N-acetylglucosaminyl deacetylase
MNLSDLAFENRRVLAIVPHQDDEVIGMGGQLAWAAGVAASLHVVLVTDGAACGGVNRFLGQWDCCRFTELGSVETQRGEEDRATCRLEKLAEFHPGDPDKGIEPRMVWEPLVSESPELEAHDAALIPGQGDGTWRHDPRHRLPFDVIPDPDRTTGTASPAWGKQRDFEFLGVAAALGIARENIRFAYWDPECPVHIKDGQVAVGGASLSNAQMAERYAAVARHYFDRLQPDVVVTMAPYEFLPPPNDHWAMAEGVRAAAAECGVGQVLYNHSGMLYQRLARGDGGIGDPLSLGDLLWQSKREALRQYLKWDPAGGWFATAAHSVPETFRALFAGAGATEYISRDF